MMNTKELLRAVDVQIVAEKAKSAGFDNEADELFSMAQGLVRGLLQDAPPPIMIIDGDHQWVEPAVMYEVN